MNFINVPLRVEDSQRKLITERTLVLKLSDDIDGLKINGIIPEGAYSCSLDFKKLLRANTSSLLPDDQWISVMKRLLPTTIQDPTSSHTMVKQEAPGTELSLKKEELNDLRLAATLVMDPDMYRDGDLKEDFDLVNNHLVISVQSNDVLSRTLGSFKMNESEEDVDLISWLVEVISMKNELDKTVKSQVETINQLKFDCEEYEKLSRQAFDNSKQIVDDLVSNFAFILSAKKRKIIELTSTGRLDGLNEKVKSEDSKLKRMINDTAEPELSDVLSNKRRKRSRALGQTNFGSVASTGESDSDKELRQESAGFERLTDHQIVQAAASDTEFSEESDEEARYNEEAKHDEEAKYDEVKDDEQLKSGEGQEEETQKDIDDNQGSEVDDSLTDYSD